MHTFELTDEEFATICTALDHAADTAVHDKGRLAFKNTHHTLIRQLEHDDPTKSTQSDRKEADDAD